MPGAITPYQQALQRAAWSNPYTNKYRNAANLIQAAWRMRRPLRYAARKGSSAVGRFFKRKRKYTPRTSSKKRRVYGTKFKTPRDQTDYTGGLNSYNQNLSRKTLWNTTIFFAKRPTAYSNALGQVTGRRIHVKGIKVCLSAINESVNPFDTSMLHFAIIQFKSSGTSGDGVKTNFFSNPGGGDAGNERDFTFLDAADEPAWDWRYNCNGINPTRYNVITHKKWRLDPRDVGKSSRTYLLNTDHYYKIGKTFQFEAAGDEQVRNPLIMCVWYDSIMPLTPATQTQRNFIDFQLNTITYFKSVN